MLWQSRKSEDAGIHILTPFFVARTGDTRIPDPRPTAIGTVGTDGHNIGRHGAPGVVAEFENWPANYRDLQSHGPC